MNITLDGIKIDEIELGDSSDISNLYIARICYKNIHEVCKLGNVSINREIDRDRAKKMVDYIKKKGSFYPTIVVATNSKNTIKYNEMFKTIDISINDENDKFIVLDGQHRFESINLIDDKQLTEKRYQSMLIVENMNNFQQRRLFLDINDTPKRVSTGTKLRFDKTIANYFSLMLLDKNDKVLDYILMDDNQTASNKEIPYKYIVRFNEKLLISISKMFKDNKCKLRDIETVKDFIILIDEKLIELIEFSQKENLEITRFEIFYIQLGEKLSENIKIKKENEFDVDLENSIKYLDEIIKNLKDISERFTKPETPKTPSDKKMKIIELINFKNSIGE